MGEFFKIALGQIQVADNASDNIKQCEKYMREAAQEGARLIVFPEGIIARNPQDASWTRKHAEPLDGPFVTALARASESFSIAVDCTVHVPDPALEGKVRNAHIVLDRGLLLARYDKLHLYDAFSAKESDDVVAGDTVPAVVEIDGWHFGLMTCYDLRFPELARRLALDGAQVLLVPSAWVRGPLKESHWEIMARARALENTVYVAAVSETSLKNIGSSMLVDPLGVAVSRAGSAPGLVTAVMSKAALAGAREALPVLANRRFAKPQLG
ncbi:MAG TPA: carbon-nitrogen hydrolase family protein [Candidatus Aphodousia gallistercoris]|nr:carbon-nitrogen hydrolase family protein [Candidatus Aphodousia gallistercoris]